MRGFKILGFEVFRFFPTTVRRLGVWLVWCMAVTGLQAQEWTYIQVDSTKQMWGDWDSPEWLRYFGLDAGDVDRDGFLDILSGRYLYHNPGGRMEKPWHRTVLDDNVDGILIMDVDGDPYADLIAMALPNLYWYEAKDLGGTRYSRRRIAEVPATSHVNSQGFARAQIIPGGAEEILVAGNGDVYLISISQEGMKEPSFRRFLIGENTSDEGIGVGDIDGDGDLDIAAGRRPAGEDEPSILVWFENPGNLRAAWKGREIGQSQHPIDRIGISDLDGNKRADIVVTEERYPGKEPDANLWIFLQGADGSWRQRSLVTQYSMNNLDLADIDGDGDTDILTAEHKGEALELQLWRNTGKGEFTREVLDRGKENHLGTRWTDLDKDGDLDIIGAGWDAHKYMHVWRNEDLSKSGKETEFRTSSGTVDRNRQRIVVDSVTYEGRPHWRIYTPSASYYLDKAGGGLSRLIDPLGNDWISFKMKPWGTYPQAAAGAFRGLPNAVFGNDPNAGAGHPGHDRCETEIAAPGVLETQTKDQKWKWSWTFEDSSVQLAITKSDGPYWFLYEGTPGGVYATDAYRYGTDQGQGSGLLPDFFQKTFVEGQYRWAYFGRTGIPFTLYLVHLNSDIQPDMLAFLGDSKAGLNSEDGMTVFGFGRSKEDQPMLEGANTFLIGLYPREIGSPEDYGVLASYINTLLKSYQYEAQKH